VDFSIISVCVVQRAAGVGDQEGKSWFHLPINVRCSSLKSRN